MRNLVRPAHAARPLLPGARADAPREVAPVAEPQAELFANLDTTFAAFAERRPAVHAGHDRARARGARRRRSASFPPSGRSSRNSAALFRELRPGAPRCAAAAPTWRTRSRSARDAAALRALNEPARRRRFDSLQRFAEDPLVPLGIHGLTEHGDAR